MFFINLFWSYCWTVCFPEVGINTYLMMLIFSVTIRYITIWILNVLVVVLSSKRAASSLIFVIPPPSLRLDFWRCRRCCRFLHASRSCWVSWDPTPWLWSTPSTSTTRSSTPSSADMTATSTRTCLSGLETHRSTPLRSVTLHALILKEDGSCRNECV